MMKKLIRITTIPLSLDKLLGEQLTYMNQFYEVTAVSADEKELERVAAKYGVQHHHVEMTRTISPLRDIAAVWRLYRFLRQQKPHIVHSHTPKAGIVGMMAAWLAGVPHRLHTVAGLPLLERGGSKRTLLNHIEKLTCRLATQVYPNSFELQKIIMRAQFCAPHKMKVIGQGSSNGIDTDHFSPAQITADEQQNLRAELGLSPDDFVFIFVGRLVCDKGINELVAAFKNVASARFGFAQRPVPDDQSLRPIGGNVKLLLVGPLEQDLDPLRAETLSDIESNPDIISVGFQEEVRPYFAVSNALVFPSYREGFPNVVLQSLAMGLPAIVTDINGCNEMVRNGFNGLVVPPKNETALQNAMEQLFSDPTLYDELKSNAQKSVLPYEQIAVWEALLEEYRGLEALPEI
ncbi:N,N'-diacetylbacillosaminyl-diphospho-undecaprenol alpha-1,3-N-acetylgalactosaminyltransferase [Chryseobacterium salivictor]|uniref:N, N'-diacetylbacillosaminyl-diphospho-undecaprenol alpha-1,3-N-acetylgalactosaminyltransferase n=2 Tax=Chryseobacterium salivictor TaxID=2547600 RepID=A0A4P6ZFH7_9FLAO|nr:N,N'-diacetylbacillosaminyl-diphospho-undecaprenol alpha-1,3-N-acetylgalactosaminyltransferase [Chryseobacterium salivictor]